MGTISGIVIITGALLSLGVALITFWASSTHSVQRPNEPTTHFKSTPWTPLRFLIVANLMAFLSLLTAAFVFGSEYTRIDDIRLLIRLVAYPIIGIFLAVGAGILIRYMTDMFDGDSDPEETEATLENWIE
jgi:hypothetical protein